MHTTTLIGLGRSSLNSADTADEHCQLYKALVFVAFVSFYSNGQNNKLVLQGEYLGQTPPGEVAEVFAPGIVSTVHRDHNALFSPDMREFYFTRKDVETKKWSLIVFESKNDQWHQSLVLPRVGRPFISPDGNVLHLGKHYMERTESGWSQLNSLGPLFDRDDWGIMRLTASATGTYVFDDYKNGDVLRISQIKNGKRKPPKLLNANINSGKWTAHPFIAHDESYLIWDSEREGGYGESDLYISFRQENGMWGKAMNLGSNVNTAAREASASVTPDGKYLFFNRTVKPGDGDIFWVDASVIENARQKSL